MKKHQFIYTLFLGGLFQLLFACVPQLDHPTIIDVPETPEGFYTDPNECACTTEAICSSDISEMPASHYIN